MRTKMTRQTMYVMLLQGEWVIGGGAGSGVKRLNGGDWIDEQIWKQM
jgi:hypothetical protein